MPANINETTANFSSAVYNKKQIVNFTLYVYNVLVFTDAAISYKYGFLFNHIRLILRR